MFTGKVAVVTGAAQGIGQAVAEAFAELGARVVIADVQAEGAEAAAKALRDAGREAISVAVDVRRSASVKALFDKVIASWGRVDILVNNAGIHAARRTIDVADEEWQRMLDINLSGVFFCCREAARHMIAGGGGRIINMGSTAAHASAGSHAGYSATKGAVVSMTRALAVEWAGENILVNSVSPGSVDTAMSEAARKRDPEAFARRDKRVPVQRAGKGKDIAGVVTFLASDAAGYITGRDILVDGGMLAQHPGYVP